MKWVVVCSAAWLAWALAGCGGGDSGEAVRGSTRLRMSIAWAERARSITGPSSALSAQVTIEKALPNGQDFVWTVSRPEAAAPQTIEYQASESVITGKATVTVRFFSGPEATGDEVGIASDVVEIKADGSGLAELTTRGTVAQVLVPDGLTVPENTSVVLPFSVRDDQGRLLAVSSGSVFWSVVSGEAVLRFVDGRAHGMRRSSAQVTATVDGKASHPSTVYVSVSAAARLVPLLPGVPDDMPNDASAISADGKWVAGSCLTPSGLRAFRWNRIGRESGSRTEDEPPLDLGVLPDKRQSAATGISATGSVVVGWCAGSDEQHEAFIWKEERGMFPVPNMPDDADESEAMAVSADGSMVVGWYRQDDEIFGFYWSQNTGFVTLGDLQGSHRIRNWSQAVSVSADGARILLTAAYRESESKDMLTQALIVRPGQSFTTLKDEQHANVSACWINHDGSVVAAAARREDSATAMPTRWTPSTGWVSLHAGMLTAPSCGSADGQLIGGGGPNPGDAFIWRGPQGYENLYNVMKALGVLDGLEGKGPAAVRGVSADGQTLVGSAGTAPFRGFVMTLPR